MNKLLLTVLVCLFCMGSVYAQHSASVRVMFSVPEVTSIKINQQLINIDLRYGEHSGLIYEPKTVTGSYNIASTGTNKRILAQLGEPMPHNMYLDLRADAPHQATSMGYVTLDATPKTIVSNVSNVYQQNLLLYFRLRAELGAPTTPTSQYRIVTLTIGDF